MTPDELLALADAATPRPWIADEDECAVVTNDGRSLVLGEWPRDDKDARDQQRATTRLIALAPSLARDHAALLKWAERANAILGLLIAAPPDQAREIGALLAEFDVLRERP